MTSARSRTPAAHGRRQVFRSALVAAAQFLLITFIVHIALSEDTVDPVYQLAGKNPTSAEIAALRSAFSGNDDLLQSYSGYVRSLITLDLGHSWVTGQSVRSLLGNAVLVSATLVLPAVFMGHLVSLALAILAAARRGKTADRILRMASAALFSTSVLILIMVLQWALSSPDALALLPARGWSIASTSEYLTYIMLPTLVLVALVIAVNLRFYRTILVEQMAQSYAVFALRQGVTRWRVVLYHAVPNILGVVLVRAAYTLPPAVFGGAFVVESYFGIPGMGQVSYNALLTGDRPVAGAMLGLLALAIVVLQTFIGWTYRFVRPQVVP